jgi:hypothetical protein
LRVTHFNLRERAVWCGFGCVTSHGENGEINA